MKTLDKHYLSLQFRDKIHSKNGAEYQTFFENIMEKAFSDFQKIRPYGCKGDSGNDGYRKKPGIYYQVYAPNVPKIKESDAAKKLKEDFQKIKKGWSQISEVKEYYFVFNDKYGGSVQLIEEAISELEKNNPAIEFKLFLAKNLEETFFNLDEPEILSLNFNIDQRQAISNAYAYLEKVEIELDKEHALYALRRLKDVKDIIFILNEESLSLEYEILECRCLQKLEKVDEAKDKYKNLLTRHPNDSRAFLYLAEIYLIDKKTDKNKELLEKAEKIDSDNWLLKLEKLVRKSYLGEKIAPATINEKDFPDDPRIQSNFYRLYAVLLYKSGHRTTAESFIEKAIKLNPDRFVNFIAKLAFIENKLFSSQDISQKIQISQELLTEIEQVENKFVEFGDIGARNKATLNIEKLNVHLIQENIPELEKVSKEVFKQSLTCYHDKQIEQILTVILKPVFLPDKDLARLLEYLKNSRNEISDEFLKIIIVQFIIRDSLETDGKKFFEDINNEKFLGFINSFKSRKLDEILDFLKDDIHFAVAIANSAKTVPELRRKIIENLPDDKKIQKEKLHLLVNFDEQDFDEAFNILKNIDISSLSYFECRPILEIIHKKEAWDFEIVILERLLEKERDEEKKRRLNFQLFNAYLNLKKYQEVIALGGQLLQEVFNDRNMSLKNKEALLCSTIVACLERGKVDQSAFGKSKEIIQKYELSEPSFEFKVGVEAETYLCNNEAPKALESVIEGVKIKKVLSAKEYAKLYFVLLIRIGNQIKFKLDSLTNVKDNTFVKLKNKDQWYFIGDGNELDAILITETNAKYPLFLGKEPKDKIVFENKYGSEDIEDEVEKIFSTEQYIIWQTIQNFESLSKDGDLDGVQMVYMPPKGETIDLKNILKLLEDLHQRTAPFFESYCKNVYPLSLLAVSEGGLTGAIGHIQQENKGFINFSDGTIEEFEKQKQIARKVINEKLPFYIDSTSALVLSEYGTIKKIHEHLPNIKVPQSVINFLAEVSERFTYSAGQHGHMGYFQGKIILSSVEKSKRDLFKSNFRESIKIFESIPQNIGVISLANKIDCLSEREIPAELCDACILSQKENIPILTEDYLYLKLNELETKKEAPEYFSSLALLRVLYDEGHIGFDNYLDYFGYLSSYRFRFLMLSIDDINKAVFGDKKISVVKPENIRKFNFPLTLAEEYGVAPQNAYKVVGGFLSQVLLDNTTTIDITDKIFIEIMDSFPTSMNKKDFGQKLLRDCLGLIKEKQSDFVIFSKNQMVYEKIEKLLQTTEMYLSETKLWSPPTK